MASEPIIVAEEVPAVDIFGQPCREKPPLKWRELLTVVLMVVLADLTLYRAYGFAGYASFFLAAPLLLCLGSPRPRPAGGFYLLAVMLLLLVARMFWWGSWLSVGVGFSLLAGFAMALSGIRPYVLETIVFASQTIPAGYEGLAQYRRSADELSPVSARKIGLEYLLPLAVFIVFALLFIVANPDLATFFGEQAQRILTSIRDFILKISPTWQEALTWLAALWLTIGLLRPLMSRALMQEKAKTANAACECGHAAGPAPLYRASRNTLLTVISLFAAYLVFEFSTLWFRDFPEGFYYSGYAHEGAAWLTAALALSTLILSLIFRGGILDDPRLPQLRRLAWVWSLENLLLAAAVYHRMGIYVDFNGMTRMRMVGIFGMACVVAGFLLVVCKIRRRRSFLWLMRRQLWALAITVFLFAITPVDAIVHHYNVRRIIAGDSAPSVQISVHPIGPEGVPQLLPLANCKDVIIREGVLAMLAERLDKAESLSRRNEKQGWTAFQVADRYMLLELRFASYYWTEYQNNPQNRNEAIKRFKDYAYQWY